ncbi:MAG: T9SS type A sorting domain-containing protein [Ignavibacteriales bacterium]|nr:T9SS type A sorting domain-containing protein [Ignavibacteriales bacterium]
MENKYFNLCFTCLVLFASIVPAQIDTVKYQWPFPPFNSSHSLTATFCEFRNTTSSDHFHNAVDIAEPGGNPCYAGLSGRVYSKVTAGYDSYIEIRTNINGQWKRINYYHIIPNPSLNVGDSVTAGVTIIGTVENSAGHVHLIDRAFNYGSGNLRLLNPVRKNGGLTPYIDTEAPVISRSSIQYRHYSSGEILSSNNLSGKIDIIIRVDEKNGPSSSHRNNGTYLLGYRVYNSDTSIVVYEPPDSGVKYKFDYRPSDSDVHKVFVKGVATLSDPVYWLTNGDGEKYINQNLSVRDNYFDTELLSEGDYVLEIFTEDTRDNKSNEFFNFKIVRKPPDLKAVLNTDGQKSVYVSWVHEYNGDSKGYRLYYSADTNLSNWHLAADENTLTKGLFSYTFNSPLEFSEPTSNDVYYFFLTAIDSNDVEGEPSDIYSRSSHTSSTSGFKKCLIVDGFDRYGGTGGWSQRTHYFNTMYFDALVSQDSLVISSCVKDAVSDNSIILTDYDIVVWFVGDNSRTENTFETLEQGRVASFLEAGKNFFVSGSDIGYDLDQSHSNSQNTDTLFYRHYLKARLEHDGNTLLSKVMGAENTVFEGVEADISQTYIDKKPDDINPNKGSIAALNYNYKRYDGITWRKGGVAYCGTFGSSSKLARMVYFSFAFETIGSSHKRAELMNKVLEFFETENTTSIDGNKLHPEIPQSHSLSQNYPNPFNPETNIEINVAKQENVKVIIYDVLGSKVCTLLDEEKSPGKYLLKWNASSFASGVYYIQMIAPDFVQSKSMILIK